MKRIDWLTAPEIWHENRKMSGLEEGNTPSTPYMKTIEVYGVRYPVQVPLSNLLHEYPYTEEKWNTKREAII